MSWASIVAAVSGKKPVWLYRFEQGTTMVFYTSRSTQYDQTNFDFFDQNDIFAAVATDFFTRNWLPSPIGRGAITRTSKVQKATLDITFPRTNVTAQSFRDSSLVQYNKAQVLAVFSNDPDAEVVTKFLGRVVAVKPGLVKITLSCENLFTTMRTKALAATMQRLCGHAQYFDPGSPYAGCKLVLADWQVSATATASAGRDITVTEAASYDDGYFSGGILEYGGDRKMILKHAGSTLTMLDMPDGIATALGSGSQSVKIAPGCNLTFQMCSAVFQNTANFGGLPFMTDNPYDGRNPY